MNCQDKEKVEISEQGKTTNNKEKAIYQLPVATDSAVVLQYLPGVHGLPAVKPSESQIVPGWHGVVTLPPHAVALPGKCDVWAPEQ